MVSISRGVRSEKLSEQGASSSKALSVLMPRVLTRWLAASSANLPCNLPCGEAGGSGEEGRRMYGTGERRVGEDAGDDGRELDGRAIWQ